MATAVDLTEWENDARLFLFTSLTAGSSHIITATSRMETILRANKLPFQAVDLATDEKARKLWGRRAGKRKLPGLVKEGYVIGDLEEVEEWNEFGELNENIGPLPAAGAAVNTVQMSLGSLRMHDAASQAASGTAPAPVAAKAPAPGVNASKIKPLSSATPTPAPAPASASASTETPPTSSLAAVDEATKPETMNSSADRKKESIRTAEDTATLAAQADPAEGAAIAETPSQDSLAVADAAPAEQKHRGSSVSKASADEIKEVEQNTAIPEGDEEESSEKVEVEAEKEESSEKPKVEAEETSEAEKIPSQEGAAAEEAEVSVED